jgi:hypothetical protein
VFMTHKKGLVTLLSALAVTGASIGIARYLAVSYGDNKELLATAPNKPIMESEWSTHAVDLDPAKGEDEPFLSSMLESTPVFIAPVVPAHPVEVTTPARPVTSISKPAVSSKPAVQMVQTPAYWVQAGSYSSLARANVAREALLVLGLAGTIHTITHEDRLYYRLRFGAWEAEAEAARFRDYLRDTENLRVAFNELQTSDRSNDFSDAYVVVSTLQKAQNSTL